MTFLGLEQPVAYGREQVFDPTTAQMVLNANRDYINAVYRDYQQAMADTKEFYEKYGDFTSPIQADMDWYYNNVTGRVKNFINDLYARGIDPIRSQEGRAAIARELATMPTKGIAQVRQSAETAKEYIKTMGALAAQGKYNADLERMAGRDLSTWNTMGDPENGISASGVWGYSSPTEYKDLNEFTGHIFDKMQDEYIGTEGGYDYLGVSRERRANALTSQIGGIMNSDLGRFHYAQSKAALESRLGRPVSDAEAMDAFKNDILTSTTEYERRNRTENKEYARQRDFYYDNKLDAAKKARDYYYESVKPFDLDDNGKLDDDEKALRKQYKTAAVTGDGKRVDSNSGVSQWEQNYNDALANAASDGYTKYDPLTVSKYYGSIGKNINAVQDYFGSGLKKDPNRDEKFKYRYTKPVDVIGILEAHGGYKDGENSVSLNLSDIGRLWSEKDILTSTRGNSSRRTRTSKPIQNEVETALKNGTKDVRMYPHGTKYGAQTKDNTFDIYAPIDIVIVDANGNIEKRIENVYWDTRWGTRESLYRPDPGPTNLFKTEQPGPGIFTNTYPTMWGASSVLPSDTRGTKSDYNASPSVKLGTSYK